MGLKETTDRILEEKLGVPPGSITPEFIRQRRKTRGPLPLSEEDKGRAKDRGLEILSDEQAQDYIREAEELADLAKAGEIGDSTDVAIIASDRTRKRLGRAK